MRVIIFSWEYPPRIVGRLAENISTLSIQLAKQGVDTYVVTYHDFLTGVTTEPSGVNTIRVTNPVRTHIGVLTWVLTLNQEVERAAANIYYQAKKHIDAIDVYDWHFVPAAVTLKNALATPFVFSVESLEDHRSPGENSPYNMAIKSIEWLGFYEAARVSAKSEWMRDEIVRVYKVPREKITVVSPNTDSRVQDVLELYADVAGGT
ncbi:glycosyltransferase family 4 protein [Candidatus Bathyarchaeota archaeon A05DMB-2]|jgi:glycosyltransferase involved in cell wall biosynthesis|nr:glycosyltransferase family 4 protein [Candidatus Bathyarchaeota archaeon A05DMB-2]